jgi:hypothetical protein
MTDSNKVAFILILVFIAGIALIFIGVGSLIVDGNKRDARYLVAYQECLKPYSNVDPLQKVEYMKACNRIALEEKDE